MVTPPRTGMPPTGALRIGVLGVADIAVRRTLPALRTLAGRGVLTAVAGRDPRRAAAVTATYGGTPYGSYQALLDSPEVDAVYVPLPGGLHGEWVDRALTAGKHVLVEKPLATDLPTTVRLLNTASARGLVLAENMTFPHHPQHAAVGRLVAAGAIGELRTVDAVFTVPPRPDGDIRYQAALGGGSLLDQGVYPIRAALMHLPGGLRVTDAMLRHDPVRDVDLGGSARLTAATGAQARVTFGMDGEYRCSYELIGTTGALHVERAFTPAPDHLPQVWLHPVSGPARRIPLDAADQFARCLDDFVRRVRGGAGTDAASLAQSAVVDRIRRAALVSVP